MTLYRDILSQALKSTWKNKYLWFFGLFAAFLGSAGEFELIIRGFSNDTYSLIPGFNGIVESGLFTWQGLKGVGHLIQSDPMSLFLAVGVLLLVLSIGLFFLWLAICSQAAIVHSAARIRMNKKHNLKTSLSVGMAKFWLIFGMNALLRIIMYVLFATLSLPLILLSTKLGEGSINFLYLVLFVLFVMLVVVLSFIIKYAIAFIVVKDFKFLLAIKQGWNLFIKNWLVSVEMAFVLFFINFLVGAGIILVFLIISIPFFFMAYIFAAFQLFFSFWLIILLALIAYVVFIALTGSFLSAFQINAWIGLFMELVSRGGVSKLVRVFSKE
ncbi:MAG: hypothetical protein U9Q85_04735 [Patescibacteria group bacterium]|nr:hypothetical protein [Patescibacteria group bacterium]